MKRKYIILLIAIFLCFIYKVNADTLRGTVNVNDALNLRDNPSSSGRIIEGLYNGTEVEILDTNAASNSDCPGSSWYKIRYGDVVGYSCGLYIDIKKSSIGNTDDSYSRSNYNTEHKKDGTVACYEDTGSITLKTSATGSSYTNTRIDCGQEVNIEETVETSSNKNCSYYYKVNTGSGSGYVCGYFINTTKLSTFANNYYSKKTNRDTIASYQEKLSNSGFPSSYFPYLLELHARHPNWNFVSEKINLSFDSVVDGESGNGASLLQKGAFNENYLSTGSNTYDVFANTFRQFDPEPGWYNASKEAIAFYLDPRNYLNEKYIFAFETLEYRSNQTPTIIENFFSGKTLFNTPYKYYNDKVKDGNGRYSDGSTGKYSEDIVNASQSANVSALHTSSRMLLEVGASGSSSSNGGSFKYCGNTYSGYYNFFNIGAYETSCGNNVESGLYRAKEEGWDTPYKSILGGAKFLTNNYISINQDTLYYERFDVSTTNGNFDHQYQQNLSAPIHEGGDTYLGYSKNLSSYLDSAITFVIPVYNDMPNYNVTSPTLGNPNNYLSSLKVNDSSVNNFNYNTYNYNVYLASDVKSVKLSATAIAKTSSVTGTGTITINSNNQINKIDVKAQNGKVRTYTITFIRSEDKKITVAEAMNNSGFKYNDKYVFGIEPNTNVSSIIGNITNYNNTTTVSVKSSDGKQKTNEAFKTGDVVTVTGSDGTKTFTTIIYGDCNGDGIISATDYMKIKNHIMGTPKLSGVYSVAADANRDGTVSAVDYVMIKNYIMGTGKIVQ